MRLLKLLKSPPAVIIGLVAGAVIGVFYKQAVPFLKPIGDFYISMLQMCVLPVLISAIVTSVSGLLLSENGRKYIAKIVGILVLALFLISAVCVAGSSVLPGVLNPSPEIKSAIGSMMSETSSHAVGFKHVSFYAENYIKEEQAGLSVFFVNMVPRNIFSALSNNENLKIIFFFSIFGILITVLGQKTTDAIRAGFDNVYKAFQTMIGFMMYFLPLGLCAMTASQFSEIGMSMIYSMLFLVLLICGASVLIFAVSFAVICVKCSASPVAQLKAMGETIFIAMGTKNSYAAMPSAISALTEKLGLDPAEVSAVLPIGISVCRFGSVMVFTLGSVFACGLYGVELNFSVIILIIVGSIFASVASSGAPGVVGRSMIAIVLDPLIIPSHSIIVMLTMIDPIIDPFTTLINVYPNCAVSAIATKPEEKNFKGGVGVCEEL